MHALATAMQQFVTARGLDQLEGSVSTVLPGVRFFRASRGNARQPLTYQSGIIIMGQGHKIIHMGTQQMAYGPGSYLVVGVPLPLECEAFSDDGEPILGLAVDVDLQQLHAMVAQLFPQGQPLEACRAIECGLSSVALSDGLNQACLRLLQALQNDVEAAILGPGLLQEILYRVLTGPNAHVLLELVRHDSHYARIARVLGRMHRDYAAALTVEALASDAHMSVSSFHRAFRQVTRVSPLQYMKQIRLNRARELIQQQGRGIAEAAALVGYNSASQFSREYKRHFQNNPRGDQR
ncbi:MAG: AraC family transcriptional regulator N-terminal domain-containing protein [Aeromonadaceae bacterium]